MTTVINFYAGPGTGKSTSAAALYYKLKIQNINSELVREYVKDWVWSERKINHYDQVYFLGKQIYHEGMLYGKVDYVVTDSPVLMNLYYAIKYSSPQMAEATRMLVEAYYNESTSLGHKHIHVFLRRSKPYQEAGRYQNEEQAREIDVQLKDMMVQMNIPFIESDTWEEALDNLLIKILTK